MPCRQIRLIQTQRRIKAENARNVCRAASEIALLTAADLPSRKTNAAADIQETDALRRMQFMRRYGLQIDRQRFTRPLHKCLYAVRMQNGIRRERANLARDCVEIVDTAELVVDVHDADQSGIGMQHLG